eukprot:8267216-Ditylum_brightwellii.AAC.1
MSILQELFESKDHVQITPYHFEIRLCGKNDECNICYHIGLQVRAPVTSKSDLLYEQKLVEEGIALDERLNFLPK